MASARPAPDETPRPDLPEEEPDAPPPRIAALEKALAILVSIAVAGSALAIGAVHSVVLVPVAAVAAAAAIVAAPLRQLGSRDRAWPAPALILLALALFTALQAVPLPLGFLAKIAPANADVWARSLLPFGERPAWGSISLDPGATLAEALKWLTYANTFFAASVLGARRGTQLVLAIVAASATLLAAVTVAHGLVDAHKVFGIYQPQNQFEPIHIGPLLNANNLAGYLTLGAITGVGLMLVHRPLVPLSVAGLGVAINIAAIVRSASRGGVAALLIGVLLLALLFRSRSAKSSQLRRRAAPIVIAAAAIVFGTGLALMGGDVWVWRELLNDNLAKLKIVSWCVPLLREYGWLGVGRGAFESVFDAYRPASGLHVVYTHPENFPAQWAAEWGIPVAAVAMCALLWHFRPGALGVKKSVIVAAGWVAVLALLLQNLVDLGLEIPAVSIAAFTVLGGVWSDPVARRRREKTRLDRAIAGLGQQRFAIGVAAAAGLLAVLTLAFNLHDVSAQREILREQFERADEAAAERPAFHEALRLAMRARPAEHYFPLLGGTAALRWRDQGPAPWKDQSPMPWIQHTLERAPVNGRAHLLLALVLDGIKRRAPEANRAALARQALLELRLALEHEPGLAERASPVATGIARTFADLTAAVPEGEAGAVVLAMYARELLKRAQHETQRPGELSRRELTDMARLADLAAIARDPKLVEPRGRLLEALFADAAQVAAGHGPGEVCPTAEACAAEIERHAAAIEAAKPESSLGSLMRGRGLIAMGKRHEAEKLLAQGCSWPEGRSDCLQARAENLAKLDDPKKLDGVLKEYMSANCMVAAQCAAAAGFVGELKLGRGDVHGAAASLMRAAQEDPTQERWLRAADVAERARMMAQAIEALSHVSSMRGGADAEINARISKLRAAAMEDQARRR